MVDHGLPVQSLSERVVLPGCLSSPGLVTSGVPQGSVLGPLLFILSVNSLTSIQLSPRAELILFADDICYHKVLATKQDCVLVHIKLSLTYQSRSSALMQESKMMVVSRKRRPPEVTVSVNDQQI